VSIKKYVYPLGLLVLLLPLLMLSDRLERVSGPSPEPGTLRPPRISPMPGSYDRSVTVRLRPNESRRRIIFTTNGALPILSSPEASGTMTSTGVFYDCPLRLDVDFPNVTVLRAVEVAGDQVGPPLEAVYAVGMAGDLPILSLTVDPEDLWSGARGIFTNPTWRGREWERPVFVAFLPAEGEVAFATSAGLRVDQTAPVAAPKYALRLYFRTSYGAARLAFPLFPSDPPQFEQGQGYQRLLLQAGDLTPTWTLLRDQIVSEIAFDLGLPAARGCFVRLFINGETWGIYRLTERVDCFFLEEHDGSRSVDILQDGRVREGSDEAWNALIAWAATHDLADPQVYAQARSQIDLANFSDWALLQQYFGFPADALYAVRPDGGRWRWVYVGGGTSQPRNDFARLQRALLRNQEYRAGAARRARALLDTSLSPGAIADCLAEATASLARDFAFERARWPNIAALDAQVTALSAGLEANRMRLQNSLQGQ